MMGVSTEIVMQTWKYINLSVCAGEQCNQHIKTAVMWMASVSTEAVWNQKCGVFVLIWLFFFLWPHLCLTRICFLWMFSHSVITPFPPYLSSLTHLTSTPRPLVLIFFCRKWWWVADLTWFPLTLTCKVARPGATSGPDLGFSHGG